MRPPDLSTGYGIQVNVKACGRLVKNSGGNLFRARCGRARLLCLYCALFCLLTELWYMVCFLDNVSSIFFRINCMLQKNVFTRDASIVVRHVSVIRIVRLNFQGGIDLFP